MRLKSLLLREEFFPFIEEIKHSIAVMTTAANGTSKSLRPPVKMLLFFTRNYQHMNLSEKLVYVCVKPDEHVL